MRLADAALEEEAIALQRDVVNILTPEERAGIAERVQARRGPSLVAAADAAERRPTQSLTLKARR